MPFLTLLLGLAFPASAESKPKFWSFEKLAAPTVPEVKGEAWIRTPVDSFILAKLNSKNLKPQFEADRYTLIRRVTLGLDHLKLTYRHNSQDVRLTDVFGKVIHDVIA